ncbi:MAG: hypothetical protein AAB152_15070 [Candidatus Coatesbacteria bacterium]
MDLLRDPVTGTEIVRLTAERSAQHHLPESTPTVTPDGRWLVFLTHETGAPNLAAMDLSSGDVRILTLRKDLNAASPVITVDGLAVLFSARDAIWAVTLEDGTETELAPFSGARVRHLATAPDGRAVAATVAEGPWNRLVEVDVYDGLVRTLLECPQAIGRLQYDPGGRRILFAGEAPGSLQVIDRQGGGPQVVAGQREGEWVRAGTWLGADSVAFVKFHDGLYVRGANGDVESERCIFKGPIWHVAARGDGRLLACDTHAPDIGLVLVSPDSGSWKVLCHPRSSNRGTRWFEPLPAPGDDEEASGFAFPDRPPDFTESRYGPAWTHPHPSFHRDGLSVFYTSDVSGVPQIYRALIPDGWFD